MSVRVGIIGVGMIGVDHARRLTQTLGGVDVVALTDVDPARAQALADTLPAARVHATGEELIAAPDVDAVLVASWGPTHEQYVLAAIAANKPVFCEKPLTPTPDGCLRIVEAEAKGSRQLVQVGYMRRYDAGYRAMKAALTAGAIGPALMAHCAHRNPTIPPYGYTSDMAITDTAVHEIDLFRWMFDEDIVGAQVIKPRRSSRAAEALQDPQIVLLEMRSGIRIDVEVYVNCSYGYDIRCEIVGETGTVSLGETSSVSLRANGMQGGSVPEDWRERFVRAYDTELKEWVDSVAAGRITGPTAWDGYAAAVVAEACVKALHSGERVAVAMAETPAFYQPGVYELARG
jgi:myo-inositol 2-dehydrogenase/D-chiro-inositol 1-dehydrogenase